MAKANMLASAWEARDIDALAALAAAAPEAALAGHVLAAAAAVENGDPRAYRHLQAAFTSAQDPETDLLLSPYRDQLAFRVSAPELSLEVQLPCTREAIGCALACAERAVGDPESAYSVLLEMPDTALVRVLRAHAALDLDWPAKALLITDLTRSVPDGEERAEHSSALWTLHAQALLALGEPQRALEVLDRSLTNPGPGEAASAAALHNRALFTRASARAQVGDTAGAWQDLTSLLTSDPAYPRAAALLKVL